MQNVWNHDLYASRDINMVKQIKDKGLGPPRDLQIFTTFSPTLTGQFKALFVVTSYMTALKQQLERAGGHGDVYSLIKASSDFIV